MIGYVVYDKENNLIERDSHGHIRVYKNRRAARRRASRLNCAVAPSMTRWSTRETILQFTR